MQLYCTQCIYLKVIKRSELYSTQVKAIGGRSGNIRSEDGILELKLALPKEWGGKGDATNPEQLFAAGYSACFIGAIKLVASREKIKVPDNLSIEGIVGIGEIDKGYGIQVELKISIPGLEHEQAHDLVNKAHQVCPYSNATRGNIEVKLTLLK